jgi:hypothetical protein
MSPPAIQMGQPVGTESSSKKKKLEEGEVTEEGFVCIGRSSFYSSTSPVEEAAIPYPLNTVHPYPPYPVDHLSNSRTPNQYGMYPELPSPHLLSHKSGETSSLDMSLESLRSVPLVLRSDLQPQIYNQGGRIGVRGLAVKTIDWSQFDYDFDFERSVIREVDQHYSTFR